MFKRFFWLPFAIIPLCFLCTACVLNSVNGQAAPVACLALDYDIPSYHVIPPQGIPAKAARSIAVTWSLYKPSPQAQSPSIPVNTIQKATMQELLFGPFSSRSAIDNLAKRLAGPNVTLSSRGTVLATSKLIVASGCRTQSFASSITLPKDLKPGYYDLYITGSSVYASGANSMGSDIPIHVLP